MKKMSFGVAFGLAMKEAGYKIGFVIAILLLLFALYGWFKLGWAYPFKYWTLLMPAAAIILIMARPANINADPVASGYSGYDK